jgi:hypothetical protein
MRLTRKTYKMRNRKPNRRTKTTNNRRKHTKGGTKTGTKKSFVKLNCSPVPVSERHISKNTCYKPEHLNKLKELWNHHNPQDKIHFTDSSFIWNELKKRFEKDCDTESCWYKKVSHNSELSKAFSDAFAPKSPDSWKENPNEWLSSSDIIDVMKQYMNIYKCFRFIGPSPIDYDAIDNNTCVTNELCHFSLGHQIHEGKNKIGIIFNTDPHTKGGEHWISLFINVKKGFIFFFDSAGNEIPKRIYPLVERIIEQGKHLKPPIQFTFDQNYPKEHQYSTTECGMYSLYFIIHMLEDKLTQDYLKTHVITDKHVEGFRKKYFNEHNI